MNDSEGDKKRERDRYNSRASKYLISEVTIKSKRTMPTFLSSPYKDYEYTIKKYLRAGTNCLELCSGMGENSETLIKTGKEIVATDISSMSLAALKAKYVDYKNLMTMCCDIETLPFKAESFDLVTCAGGLSYGNNRAVMQEIHRVLRPGGTFVCVDSLNNNPIYKFNRIIHYLRGNRTLSTLQRMPTKNLIRQYEKCFSEVDCRYYGKFTWALAGISWLVKPEILVSWSDSLDYGVRLNGLAFKFVMEARKNDR